MLARALIVLLLILNLGVALWWATRGGEPEAPPDVALPPGSERLRLLEETPVAAALAASVAAAADPANADTAAAGAEPQAAAPAEPASPAPPASSAACFAFGPFADSAARDRARDLLQARATRVDVRESRAAPRGWRVFLPALADREAANAMATRLTAAGFKDHYIMPAEGAMDIALGRFGSETAAQRHQAALRTAGFDVRAEPIGEPGDVRYWIDVEAREGFDAVALRRATGATQAESIACAAPAARKP